MNQNKALALVLAAGNGTRMKSKIPKPLNLVYNKPIISWVINFFKKENIDVGLIINPKDKQYFKDYKNLVSFIYQKNPNGTGHAVMQAKKIISNYDNTYVFVGDSPFVDNKIIAKMYASHLMDNSDCTILSSIFFEKAFPYARIVRKNGSIIKFVEEKDANKIELKINELFCSHYLFKSKILLEFIDYLKPDQKNNEIYLTDILNNLVSSKKNINSIVIEDWKRLVGLNTKEDISWIESQKIT